MLDPRAVAVQGIGFSPLLVAVQGFAEPEAVSTRSSGGASQLKRISDAKVTVYGAASVTRAGRVAAIGADVQPQVVVVPAQSYVRGSASTTRAHNARASAAAACFAGHTARRTHVAPVDAIAAARGYALSASHHTRYADPAYAAGSSTTLRGVVSITSSNAAGARGQKRLTPAKLAAIAAVVDTH